MSEWLRNGVAVVLAAMVLAGCGGSGSSSSDDGDGGGGTTPTLAVAVTILDASGNATNNVTPSSPGTVRATVTSNGAAVANTVVTFTTTLGSLNPTSGTALTNSAGQATVTLEAGSVAGAGTVRASVSVNGTSAEGSAAFSTTIPANDVTMTVTVPNTPVSAGGTTTVTATLTNSDNTPFATTVPVTFTSGCVSAGTAVLNTPVDTVNGVATSTYRAQGCVGTDTINVSSQVGGSVLTGTATVSVVSASLGSIEFVSATPETIALKGTGDSQRPETSTVVFRVRDAQGNPLNNVPVTFTLDTNAGNILLAPASAQTDANGLAQTVVTAGTIATSVRVTAVASQSGVSFSTTSSLLVVSTGLPDQDSISISASNVSPEAWEVDGVQVTITARMADAFNNPPPVGTAIQFRTEGGSIQPSCTTDDTGACSVVWRSQSPRPIGDRDGNGQDDGLSQVVGVHDGVTPCSLPVTDNTGPLGCSQPYGGRVTILATAIGTESFPDINGNGVLDGSEDADFLASRDVEGNPYDLSEAFLDSNEDGGYRLLGGPGDSDATETFVDFDGDSAFDSADSKYNGVLCYPEFTGVTPVPTASALCADGTTTRKTMHVRDSLVIVMSSNDIRAAANVAAVCVANESIATVSVTFADYHNQPPPSGTTIRFSTNNGTIPTGANITVPQTAHNGGITYSVSVKGNTDATSRGTLFAEITTPRGIQRTLPIAIVDDVAAQGTCP